MKRRITAMMLVFVMVFSLIPAGTMKAAGATTPTFTYDVSGSNATITGYTDTTVKDLVVPENVDGYTVTAVADGAFSWTKYPNLVNLTVRGANVNIGSRMCGFDSAGSRNDNIVLWGADGSTLETYAASQLLTFKEVTSQMSDIRTEANVNSCYTGSGSFKVYTYIETAGGNAAEDIIWESEDSSQATVMAFGTPVKQNDGTYKAEATVNVLSKGDGTCKIYASARGLDAKKELELTIKQSATAVNVETALYALDEEAEELVLVDTLDTFHQNRTVTADVNTFLWVKPSVVGSAEDYAEAWTSAGSGEYIEYRGTHEGGYMFSLLKTTGSDYTTLTFTSASLVCSTTLNVRITNPAKDFTMQVNENDVDGGGSFLLIEGDKAELGVILNPLNSTDTVEWSSSNTNVATVAEDGSLTTLNSGKTTITCKVSDTAGVARRLQKSFELQVMKKVLYNKLGLSDSANGNVITELDLEAGKTCRVYPVDTEPGDSEANEHLIYTSNNSSLVTVDQDGNITAASGKTGSAIITASAARSDTTNTTASIVVNVYVKATSIGISSAEQIPQGQSKDVKYTLSPSGASEDIIWTPADASVVSVKDNGDSITITALKVGNTTIEGRSKSGGATVSIQVVVQEPIHMTNLGIAVSDRNSYRNSYEDEDGVLVYEVPKGENIVFEPDFLPLNSNDSLTWSYDVDNLKVATGVVNSTNYEVTAQNVGKQTFTLKSSNGLIAKCRIEVIIPATRLDICNGTSTNVINTATVGVGGSINVNGYMGASVTDYCTWTASNDNVSLSATETSNRGTVTIKGLKVGTTTITATSEDGEYSATLEVTVNIPVTGITFKEGTQTLGTSIDILPNSQKEISIVATPANNTAQKYTWTSVSGRVSITPSSDGTSAVIIGQIVGNDTIKVTADTGYTKSIQVKVLQPSDSITFTCTETTVNKGSKVTAIATVTPDGANDGIKYTTSVDGVVKLTPASNGKSVTIEGIGVGTVTITATTGSGMTASIDITVVTIEASELTVSGIISTGYTYKGAAIEPTITVKHGSTTLKKDTDYTVECSNNINVTDEAVITITGIGKYSGTIERTFKINPKSGTSLGIKYKENNATSVSRVYNGAAYKPKVSIVDGALVLTEGKDFTVTYPSSPVKVGTYTLTVNYKGNYSGTKTASYKVTAKNIADNTILVSGISSTGYTYTTNAITPKITIKDGSKTLVLGTGNDYTVTYSANTNVSTSTQKAKITIRGIGNYTGTRVVEFKIIPADISKATATKIADKIYTGSAQKPAPVLKFGGKSVSSANYTLTYSANKNTGKATITVKGKGNFKGTKKVTFKILPKQVTGVKQTNATKSSVTLSWSKAAGYVTGYNIYKYSTSTKKYTYVGTTTSTKYTVKKLASGKDYKYAVCAYKKVGTSKYLGAKSAIYTAKTSCGTPKMSSITSPSKKMVKVTWKKTTGANQYYVYVSTNGKTYTLKAKPTSTSVNITGLTSGKKCYVKIKAVRNINGKSYTSAYSAVKSIKVK